MKKTTTSEAGRSLIEMVLTVGVMCVITIGAMTGINFAWNRYRATQIQIEVELIAQDVLRLYSFFREFPNNINTQELCLNKALPNCSDGVGKNMFDGSIVVKYDTGDKLTVTYTNIPNDICYRLSCSVSEKWTTNVSPKYPNEKLKCFYRDLCYNQKGLDKNDVMFTIHR